MSYQPCIYCQQPSTLIVEGLFRCKPCFTSFKFKNNSIQYIFIYYKNCRIYFAQPDTCLFQICSNNKFQIWKTISAVDPNIIKLPLNKIHKKLDSLLLLIPYM